MKRIVAALLLILTASAVAADRDVKAVTKAIEQRYGVKHTSLPLIARMVMKPAMWGSAGNMDFAVFEDVQVSPVSAVDLDALARKALDSSWNPFVRSHSRDGETAVIYVRNTGKQMEMMIVSVEPNEAAVVKMRLGPSDMKAWIDDPAGTASDRKHNGQSVRATKHTPDDDI